MGRLADGVFQLKTIGRPDLYRLVWDRPISHVAKELGLSDRGLTKICIRHEIPVPPRGYWAKKQAGHDVAEIPLPKIDTPFREKVNLPRPTQLPPEVEALRARQLAERETPDEELVIPAPSPHKLLRPLIQKVRKQKAAFTQAGQLRNEKVFGIEVSAGQAERLIALLDRIVRLGEERGLAFSLTDKGIRVQQEEASLPIDAGETYVTLPHELTDQERKSLEKWQATRDKRARQTSSWTEFHARPQIPEYDQVYSGRLFFRIVTYESGLRESWQDGSVQRLDPLCAGIVDTIEAHFLAGRLRKQEAEQRQRELAILKHRSCLAAQRRTREEDRLNFLRTSLDQVSEAARIQDFLQLYDRQSGGADLERFIAWAQARAETLARKLSPERLDARLREAALFPEPDPLQDPFDS